MESVRNLKGKTAPETGRGIFMSNFVPVVACALQVQEGRGDLFSLPQFVTVLSPKRGFLYKNRPKYETECQLSASPRLCGGKNGPRLGVPGPFSPHVSPWAVRPQKALKSNARPFFCQVGKSDLFTVLFGRDISGVGGTQSDKKQGDSGTLATGQPNRDKRHTNTQRRFAPPIDLAKEASFKAFERVEPNQGPLGRFACCKAKTQGRDALGRIAGVSL